MSNIRTVNKRQKRALAAAVARNKTAETSAAETVEPVKAAD